MLKLLDKMFIKRFCLPVNADIDCYENGDKYVSSCVCGDYNHVSCVFYGGNGGLTKTTILTFGVNQMGDSCGKMPGVHAEYDALSKLEPLRNRKRLVSINLLVVRLSSKNKIQSSKPCHHCIEMMKIFPAKIGYTINNIYYSHENGSIIKTKLSTLEGEEKHHSRYFRRKFFNINEKS